MKKLFFLGLIFLGLSAFGQEKKDTKADEKAIREISKKWLELQNKHDIPAMAALFADEGISYRTNMEPAKGPDAIKKQFMKLQDQNPKEVADWSTDRVDVAASGDLAVEYGKFDEKNLGPNGTETDKGNYVTVYRKINGVWKVVADVASSSKTK